MEGYCDLMTIDEGSFGVVYKATKRATRKKVALKVIHSNQDVGLPSWLIREISLLRELHHPNIVALEDVILEERRYTLVFELLSMDLRDVLTSLGSSKFMKRDLVKSYLMQMLSAVLYCHRRRILHRDLKPENMLLDSDTGIIKVADFGMSRAVAPAPPTQMWTPGLVTLWYRAPEVLLGSKSYSFPIDVWSLACIFYEMSSSKPLFNGETEIEQLNCIFKMLRTPTETTWPGVSSLPDYKPTFRKWKTFNLLKNVQHLNGAGVDLLKKMVIYDPVKRISVAEARAHCFFRGVALPPSLASHAAYTD